MAPRELSTAWKEIVLRYQLKKSLFELDCDHHFNGAFYNPCLIVIECDFTMQINTTRVSKAFAIQKEPDAAQSAPQEAQKHADVVYWEYRRKKGAHRTPIEACTNAAPGQLSMYPYEHLTRHSIP